MNSLYEWLTTCRLFEDGRISLTNIAVIASTIHMFLPGFGWPHVAAFLMAMAAYVAKKLIFNIYEAERIGEPDEIAGMHKEIDSLRAAIALGRSVR